jgi:hypothetical protein
MPSESAISPSHVVPHAQNDHPQPSPQALSQQLATSTSDGPETCSRPQNTRPHHPERASSALDTLAAAAEHQRNIDQPDETLEMTLPLRQV